MISQLQFLQIFLSSSFRFTAQECLTSICIIRRLTFNIMYSKRVSAMSRALLPIVGVLKSRASISDKRKKRFCKKNSLYRVNLLVSKRFRIVLYGENVLQVEIVGSLSRKDPLYTYKGSLTLRNHSRNSGLPNFIYDPVIHPDGCYLYMNRASRDQSDRACCNARISQDA